MAIDVPRAAIDLSGSGTSNQRSNVTVAFRQAGITDPALDLGERRDLNEGGLNRTA
jgi:hypothetical protein